MASRKLTRNLMLETYMQIASAPKVLFYLSGKHFCFLEGRVVMVCSSNFTFSVDFMTGKVENGRR